MTQEQKDKLLDDIANEMSFQRRKAEMEDRIRTLQAEVLDMQIEDIQGRKHRDKLWEEDVRNAQEHRARDSAAFERIAAAVEGMLVIRGRG